MSARNREEGMILVNVLMFVAIAAGLVLLMINREELALDRGLRSREAARALAVVRGGELSALVALRRDAEQAPETDYAGEPWGKLSEAGAPIEGGSFDLAIADAEGRFNVNAVRSGEVGATLLFQTIGEFAGLTPEQIVAAIEYVRLQGPVSDLGPLRMSGIDPRTADRLERLVTALPGTTSLNLNAADGEMLGLLFHDPVIGARLAAIRDRQGFLSAKDLADANVALPRGTSFRSNTFWVRTRATIGGTSQQGASLIQRRRAADGSVEVMPVERWRGPAVPPGAPPLPVRS